MARGVISGGSRARAREAHARAVRAAAACRGARTRIVRTIRSARSIDARRRPEREPQDDARDLGGDAPGRRRPPARVGRRTLAAAAAARSRSCAISSGGCNRRDPTSGGARSARCSSRPGNWPMGSARSPRSSRSSHRAMRGRTPCAAWPAISSGSPTAPAVCKPVCSSRPGPTAVATSRPITKRRRPLGTRRANSAASRIGCSSQPIRCGRRAAGRAADKKARGQEQEANGERDIARQLDRLAERLAGASGNDEESRKLSEQLARTQQLREKLDQVSRALENAGRQNGRTTAAASNQKAAGERGRTGEGRQGAGGTDMTRLREESLRQLRETKDLLDDLQRQDPSFSKNGAGFTFEGQGPDPVRARHRSVQAGLRQVGHAQTSGDRRARAGRIHAVEEAAGEEREGSAGRRTRRSSACRIPETGRQLLQGDRGREKAIAERWPLVAHRSAVPDAFRLSPSLVARARPGGSHRRRHVRRVPPAAGAADAIAARRPGRLSRAGAHDGRPVPVPPDCSRAAARGTGPSCRCSSMCPAACV